MTRTRVAVILAAALFILTTSTAAPAASSNIWTSYSGKPSGTLTVSSSWKGLDARSGTPPFSGIETHMLYLNLTPKWKSGRSVGVCRLRYRRDAHNGKPADDTGYTDYTIHKSALIGGKFTMTHIHEEKGQAGRNGRWYIRCAGGIRTAKIGTRYEKASAVR